MTAAMHSLVLLPLRLPCSCCTLTLPTLPASLDCAAAAAYTTAPDATYTNGATGACENSGTIAATVTPTGHSVPGGSITVTYTGVDDCGNALTGSATITVTLLRLLLLHCLHYQHHSIVPLLPLILLLRMLLILTEPRVLVRTAEQLPGTVTPTWTLCAWRFYYGYLHRS